ncbi:putative mavicyanin isoform X1 [Iris pallida]|uniref:Mavicyanin isoform X1 n=1 Tax=Iris pallida TaxID=29817 RepID=A0AAX6FWC3_IRIPA|nr:putative mavicyanin isoform X1 [Iris pallida]
MAMASSLLFFFFLFAARFGSSSAAVYTVGDKQGWTTMGTPNYTAWAEEVLPCRRHSVFLYNNTFHNVVEVKKSDYDACTVKSAIETHATGKDSITIKTAGTHYYLCGFPGHCAIGQKVAIAASAGKSVAPAPSAAPSPRSSGSGSGSASAPAPQGVVTPPGGSGGGASVPAPAPKASSAAAVGQKGLGLVVFSLVIAAAVSAGSLFSA